MAQVRFFVASGALLVLGLLAPLAEPHSTARGPGELFPAQPTLAAPLAGWSRITSREPRRTVRWVGSASFSVAGGEAVDPTIAPGGESVRFATQVRIPKAGRYRFGFEGQGGSVVLTVKRPGDAGAGISLQVPAATSDPLMLAPLELERGTVELGVLFTRDGAGPARLLTLWQRESGTQAGLEGGAFGPEPIHSQFTRVLDELREETDAGENAFVGRMLLQRKGCVQCHDVGQAAHMLAPLEAPRLSKLGERASRAWVERWIRDPGALKPGSDMPSLYPAGEGDSAAVAAWLTQHAPDSAAEPVAAEAFVIERGRRLYHTLGCVACHGAYDEPSALFGEEHAALDDEMPAANFGDLAGKWRPAALSAFLRDPHDTRPSGRMPSLLLGQDEADAVANYLITKWGPGGPASPPGFGEVLTLSQCSACHEVEGIQRAGQQGKPLAQLDPARGCLDPKDRATPRYAFAGRELELLRAGLADAQLAAGVHAPHDAARRRVLFLDCGACHGRDGRGGGKPGARAYFTSLDEKADLGNEGRIPPDLSGVGFKLTTPWFQEVLDSGARARPYLATRMPVFGKATAGLAAEVARCEGVRPHGDAPEPEASDELVQAGRALMGKQALACITCHDFRDFASAGTPGPRIEHMAERLRREWWISYMRDPSRYKPGTRMPSFESGGQSACRTILGGDLERQLDALWSYLNLGEFMPAPEGLEKTRGLQLVVGARPIVLRTFLASVGPRAIAVGMPSGVHFAFDAQSVRLAEVWRGDFLDASSSWTGRGGENAGGEGPVVWKAPAGPLLMTGPLDAPGSPWPTATGKDAAFQFLGYSLGEDGVPQFEYRWKECLVRERVTTTAAPRLVLRREFELLRPPPSVVLNLEPGSARILYGTPALLDESAAADGSRRIALVPQSSSDTFRFTLEIEP